MVNSIFLLPAEQKKFDALPAALRAEWKTVAEKGTRFETDYELAVRAGMMEMENFPKLKKVMQDVKAGKTPDLNSLNEIPQEALPEFFFTIGARGMTNLISHAFASVSTDDDLMFIAAVAHLRHDVLTANGKILSAA
jgi:hypothetical protein